MSNPVFHKDGTKKWYNEQGDLHREDGPAMISGGDTNWCLNGIEYTEEEYNFIMFFKG